MIIGKLVQINLLIDLLIYVPIKLLILIYAHLVHIQAPPITGLMANISIVVTHMPVIYIPIIKPTIFILIILFELLVPLVLFHRRSVSGLLLLLMAVFAIDSRLRSSSMNFDKWIFKLILFFILIQSQSFLRRTLLEYTRRRSTSMLT